MSDRIKALQTFLKTAGFYAGILDGDDGPKTNAAIIAFQVSKGGIARRIDYIAVHCTATAEGREVSVAEITRGHKARGFDTIGYHFVTHLDGVIENGRPLARIGAHVTGYNHNSIGFNYVGGLMKDAKTPKDTRTPAQKTAMAAKLRELAAVYPAAEIKGHRDFSPDTNHNGKVDTWEWIKVCPCFDAPSEYRSLQTIR